MDFRTGQKGTEFLVHSRDSQERPDYHTTHEPEVLYESLTRINLMTRISIDKNFDFQFAFNSKPM